MITEIPKTKICTKCKIEKPLEDFSFHPLGKFGRNPSCRNCHNKISRESKERHKDSVIRYRHLANRKSINRYASIKWNAIQRNITFVLKFEEYLPFLSMPCHYCEGKLSETGGGLDRMDNNKGYSLDNVVPCCAYCNEMKSDKLTYDEMVLIWDLRKQIIKRG